MKKLIVILAASLIGCSKPKLEAPSKNLVYISGSIFKHLPDNYFGFEFKTTSITNSNVKLYFHWYWDGMTQYIKGTQVVHTTNDFYVVTNIPYSESQRDFVLDSAVSDNKTIKFIVK